MFHQGEWPFVRLLMPYMAGIILAWNFPVIISPGLCIMLLGFLLIAFSVVLLIYQRSRLYRYPIAWSILIHFFLLLSGLANTIYQNEEFHKEYFTNYKARTLLVSISSEPVIHHDIARFQTKVHYADKTPALGQLLIALKVDSTQVFSLQYGDLLLIPAAHHEVEPAYNPGEFDFKNYLKTRQIAQQCFINEQQIKRLNSGYGNPLLSFALKLRRKIVDHFYAHIPHPAAAAFASTLIMGYRADLSPETLSAYSKTGTMHVLSVSGMHVALVFLMLTYLLKPLNRFRRFRFIKPALLIGIICFYALLSGFSPSVNRAALMLSFVVLAKALNKSVNTYNLLAVSAFILLIIEPYYLFDIGFQLSYLAVIGLISLQPKIYGLFYFKHKFLDAIWNYTALSVAAQAITFPLSLYIFHQFPVYFLLSNLFIVIPVTLMMYIGVVFVLLLPFEAALCWLGQILDYLIINTNSALAYIAHLPFSNPQGMWIDAFQMVLLYAVILSFLWFWINKRKMGLYMCFLFLILFLIKSNYANLERSKTRQVLFYSLRKNTAIAYVHGAVYDLITDLDSQDKAFQFSVAPALSRWNLQKGQCIKPNQICYSEHLSNNGHLIQMGSLSILRWTADLNARYLQKPIHTDVLLLSMNPKIELNKLIKWVNFKRLLIDGTNPDYKIRAWIAEAQKLNINYDVLKKNPAIIISL